MAATLRPRLCALYSSLVRRERSFTGSRLPRRSHTHTGRGKWLRRHAGRRAAATPTPFKFFVFAAGVFEFASGVIHPAITLARLIRYFGIGYLAIRYGQRCDSVLKGHKLEATVIIIYLSCSAIWVSVILHPKPEQSA